MSATRNGRIALFMPAFSGGGSARVMVNLARGFVERGKSVDLVVTRSAGPLRSEVAEGVNVVDLDVRRISLSGPGLLKYLRHAKPAVIVSALPATNCLAIVASKVAGSKTRVVVSEHNTLTQATENASDWRKKMVPYVMRASYPYSDEIVAVSRGVATDLQCNLRLPAERIKVIYNPIVTPELLRLAEEEVRHPWFGAGQPPVVLGVGRFIPQKDFGVLLEAFAMLRKQKHAKLIILGEGPDRGWLEERISMLQLDRYVDMPGFVSNPYAYMRRSAVFALSSRWEGFGNVLVEAMASGTPVVSTDCPSGPAEILENGKWGRLVNVGDAQGLADAIVAAFDGDGVKGQERAFAFESRHAVDAYLEVLGV